MSLQQMGDIIREAREAIPETQDELSFRSGVSQGWISQVELGHVGNPSAGRIRKVADALGLDARILFAAQFDIPFGDVGGDAAAPLKPPTPPDNPVQLIEQIAALTSRLDALMRAEGQGNREHP